MLLCRRPTLLFLNISPMLLTLGAVLTFCGPVSAQPEPSKPYGGSRPAVNNRGGGGWGGGWGRGYHASTAAEGYMRGMGAAISAQGEANLNNSLAARNYQEAYDRALDNRVKQVETYRWRRDSALARQEQERYERRKKIEPRLAKARLKDLTVEQFDPTTGFIEWPVLLRDPKWNDFRNPLEALLKKRAEYGALTMDEYMDCIKIIKDWRMAVTDVKDDYPTSAVSTSLRFLLSLDREIDRAIS